MPRWIALATVFGCLTLPVTLAAATPSFDCAKAGNSSEEAICADDGLAALDVELARVYDLAVNGPNTGDRLDELRATQRGWIKGRDDCWKSDLGLETCVAYSYASRIAELRTLYADARSSDDTGASLGPYPYVCEGIDAALSVTFVNTPAGHVVIRWLDQEVVLPRVPAASGTKYEGDAWFGGPALFWSKGREATFQPPGGDAATCLEDEIG